MSQFIPLPGLVLRKLPPPNRRGFCAKEDNDHEHRLSEAAVMLSFAIYLFGKGAKKVTICPDGMHGKQFEIRQWLLENRFHQESSHGRTDYGGTYVRERNQLKVWLRSGQGDVTTTLNGQQIVAECKGGIFNSTHNGVRSALRSGLREAVGALMERPSNERNIAVVPDTLETRKFAAKASKRAAAAGIEIALVTAHGQIIFV